MISLRTITPVPIHDIRSMRGFFPTITSVHSAPPRPRTEDQLKIRRDSRYLTVNRSPRLRKSVSNDSPMSVRELPPVSSPSSSALTTPVGQPIMDPNVLSEIMDERLRSNCAMEKEISPLPTSTSEEKPSESNSKVGSVLHDDDWFIFPLRPAPRHRRQCVVYDDTEAQERVQNAPRVDSSLPIRFSF